MGTKSVVHLGEAGPLLPALRPSRGLARGDEPAHSWGSPSMRSTRNVVLVFEGRPAADGCRPGESLDRAGVPRERLHDPTGANRHVFCRAELPAELSIRVMLRDRWKPFSSGSSLIR
jgi:hypothetical protein